MAYTLQAFIVHESSQYKLTDFYKTAVAVRISEDLSLIPFSAELYQEINNNIQSKQVGRFDSFTENIEAELLKHIDNIKIAYIEAEYFGGRGEQMAINWEGGQRIYISDSGPGEINKVLKEFEVNAMKGTDEFDMVSLGRYKKTEARLKI